jgi:hypothetical protein
VGDLSKKAAIILSHQQKTKPTQFAVIFHAHNKIESEKKENLHNQHTRVARQYQLDSTP